MSLASEKKLAVTEHQILFVPHFSFFLFVYFFFLYRCGYAMCSSLSLDFLFLSSKKSRQMSCLFIKALSFSRRHGVCFAHFFSCPERDNGPRFHLCAIYAFLSYANALRKSPSLVNVHLLFTSPPFFFFSSSSLSLSRFSLSL